MEKATIKVSVLLESSFWVGIFERNDDQNYAVARHVFGNEPTDPQLYEFISTHYFQLNFSEPQDFKLIIKRKNYKKMQRDVRKEVEKIKSGSNNITHAQETLRVELEKNKKVRKQISKSEKEEKQRQDFLLKQAKKKKKLKGH